MLLALLRTWFKRVETRINAPLDLPALGEDVDHDRAWVLHQRDYCISGYPFLWR